MDLVIETYSQCQTESAVLQSLHCEHEMLNYIRKSLVEFCIRFHGQLGITGQLSPLDFAHDSTEARATGVSN